MTLPLPTRPGHVHAYLLPGDDGWTLVDTGVGLPEAKETWAAALEQAGGRVATVFVTHFHPDHVGAAADLHELTGAPVVAGHARLRPVRARLGEPCMVGAARRLVPASRRSRRRHRGARRPELGLPTVHPLPARPDPRRGRRACRRLGAHRSAGACGRPALSPARRRPRRRGPSAGPDHADGRAVAREPSRSTRRLSRRARADDRARAENRIAGPRRPDRGSRGPRSRATGAPPGASRGGGGRAHGGAADRIRALVRPLRRGSAARGTALRDRRDALASRAPRAGRCRSTSRGRRSRYLYSRLIDGRRDPA